MKKIKSLILASLILLSAAGIAQTQKIGFINSQELITLMPDTKAAEEKLRAYQEELTKTGETMQKDLQAKSEEFQKNQDNYSPLIKQSKEKEIRGMYERIQEFNVNAQKDLRLKQQTLFQPIREKAMKAISDVARKLNVTYVIDKALGGLIFEGAGSINLLDDVKKELKITK
jgi:outer membrane protein